MNRSVARWVLLSMVVLSFTAASFGQIAVGISVRDRAASASRFTRSRSAPAPVTSGRPATGHGDDDDGYYWVPGTWVVAPVGMLWTPGYWGWGGGFYAWHAGYWGPHIGFYGGINYGFGYTGVGFAGGEWRGGAFYYNRSVTNVSVTNVTNVYNRTVVVNNKSTTSFNGGTGGVAARPTHEEEAYAREHHTAPLRSQTNTSTQPARIGETSRRRIMVVQRSQPRPVPATSAVIPRFRPGLRAANTTRLRCRLKRRA